MKNVSRVLISMAVMAAFPVIAGAAGTYYNGNLYQNPQGRYGMNGNNSGDGFYNKYGAGRGYGQNMQGAQNMENMGIKKTVVQTTTTTSKKAPATSARKHGFLLDAGISHEFADWGFEMKNAGSKLHYDNLRWNVFGVDGAYYFDTSVPMQIKAGAKYGMQFGDSSMVDDDVSEGALWTIDEYNVIRGTPALSVGTSNGGKQMDFNVSFGLTDLFNMGRVKVTPSVGYRYFKYELETKNNYGMMVQVVNSPEVVNCLVVQTGEIQCSPYVSFTNGGLPVSTAGFDLTDDPQHVLASQETDVYGNTIYVMLNSNNTYVMSNDTSASQINVGQTYYYEQSGVSHKYETSWMGPYLALDMEYMINDNNNVVAGIEFGLPVYESKGDQPYRIDWAHPTSVEDKGNFGDAYHLGFNAAWMTKITNSVGFTLGLTYDYYKVSGASATTYLNPVWYQQILDNTNAWVEYYESLRYEDLTDAEKEDFALWKIEQTDLEACKANGWKSESENEIESIYKSMGIRAGIEIKF